MAQPLPWPSSDDDRAQISALVTAIEAMIATLETEGLGDQNYFVFKALIPTLIIRGHELQAAAQRIADLFPKRRPKGGRWPLWYTVTLDIIALAQTVVECADDMRESTRRKEIVLLRSYVKCVDRAAAKMRRALSSVPEPEPEAEPDPEVWEIDDILKGNDQ